MGVFVLSCDVGFSEEFWDWGKGKECFLWFI
jgi:hypothetical protein